MEIVRHFPLEALNNFFNVTGCFFLCINRSVKCRPLHLPQSQESVVIQPGLFKGTYSYHGIELVMLTYDDEDGSAVFTKITVIQNSLYLIQDCYHHRHRLWGAAWAHPLQIIEKHPCLHLFSLLHSLWKRF